MNIISNVLDDKEQNLTDLWVSIDCRHYYLPQRVYFNLISALFETWAKLGSWGIFSARLKYNSVARWIWWRHCVRWSRRPGMSVEASIEAVGSLTTRRVYLSTYYLNKKRDLYTQIPHISVALKMVSLTVSAAAKPPPFARDFPLTIEVKPEATVADVKTAISTKFSKVRPYIYR